MQVLPLCSVEWIILWSKVDTLDWIWVLSIPLIIVGLIEEGSKK